MPENSQALFHRAFMGASIKECTIHPDVRFWHTFLCGISPVCWNEKQIANAKFFPSDRIVAKTSAKITVFGKEYELCRPASCLKKTNTCDEKLQLHQSAGSGEFISLLENHPSPRPRVDDDLLYDVVGMGLKRLEGWAIPKGVGGDYCTQFYLNAHDVVFSNFAVPRQGVMLVGNFDRACITNSCFRKLILGAGSFREFDLAKASIKQLSLDLDRSDLTKIKFPIHKCPVILNYNIGSSFYAFDTDISTTRRILGAWHSKVKCANLGMAFLERVQTIPIAEKRRILWSYDTNVQDLTGLLNVPVGDFAIAANLLVRRNHLIKSPRAAIV